MLSRQYSFIRGMSVEEKREVRAGEQDVVSKCIGDFGRWQLLLTFILSLGNFPATFHIFAPTFEAAENRFWCAKPQEFRHLSTEQWINISAVYTVDPSGHTALDPCTIKDLREASTYSELLGLTGTNNTVPCTEWEFDNNVYGDTIIKEWDLVCSRKYLSQLAEMAFLLGVAIGGITSGIISDRFGRKRTLVLGLTAQITIGTMIAMTPWFPMYIALRGLLGFVSVGVVFSGFVLCMEMVGGKWLTYSGVSYMFPLPLSYMLVAGIAYYVQNWREFQLAITLPPSILLLNWIIMPESPRWLLATGKTDKAMIVLEKAAKFNKKDLPPNVDKMLKQTITTTTDDKASIMDLFRTPKIRRISLLLYVVWFSLYLVYYGLVLNLSNLGGNIYMNCVISGVVELPAIALSILFLLKLGRRWPLFLTTFGAGVACLLTIPVPKDGDLEWLTLVFAMAGKFAISSSNVVLPVFTAELFPTTVRNMGIGASNIPGGIALLLIPYLWNMAGMNVNMPMGVLGVVGAIGGLAVLLLPETGGALNDTIDDLESS